MGGGLWQATSGVRRSWASSPRAITVLRHLLGPQAAYGHTAPILAAYVRGEKRGGQVLERGNMIQQAQLPPDPPLPPALFLPVASPKCHVLPAPWPRPAPSTDGPGLGDPGGLQLHSGLQWLPCQAAAREQACHKSGCAGITQALAAESWSRTVHSSFTTGIGLQRHLASDTWFAAGSKAGVGAVGFCSSFQSWLNR